jgi:hypothetical protein
MLFAEIFRVNLREYLLYISLNLGRPATKGCRASDDDDDDDDDDDFFKLTR